MYKSVKRSVQNCMDENQKLRKDNDCIFINQSPFQECN